MPPEAVYLGTDIGGEFVTLSRVDLKDPEGRVVPAYRMQIIAAWANRRNYGEERVGGEVFKGIGIYVPPEFCADGRKPTRRPIPPWCCARHLVRKEPATRTALAHRSCSPTAH